MNRDKHLIWCKTRALEYLGMGDVDGAFASMYSDLQKHRETESHAGIEIGLMLKIGGHLSTTEEMRKFIEGFN